MTEDLILQKPCPPKCLLRSQDLCSQTWSWPPLSALQVVKANVNASCNQACRDAGLICEPSFFPHLNNFQSLARYTVADTSLLVHFSLRCCIKNAYTNVMCITQCFIISLFLNVFSCCRYGVECETWELSADHLVFPAYSRKHCLFQSDPLLFSCARSKSSWTRVCPCRDFIKDQIALCRDCL